MVCKLDKVHRIGNLVCKVCGQSHQCVINSSLPRILTVVTDYSDLSAPIDVYSDWIDAAEAVGKVGAGGTRGERDDEYDEDDGVEA